MDGLIPDYYRDFHNIYYIAYSALSLLAMGLFVCLIVIKLSDTSEEKFKLPLNWLNLAVCSISSFMLLYYSYEFISAWQSDHLEQRIEMIGQLHGQYYEMQISLLLFAFLLSLFFWKKSNRLNIKFGILIYFVLNLAFWFQVIVILLQ